MIHDHQVRERAYYIWENEGCVGSAAVHWQRAEAELSGALLVQPVAAEPSLAPSPAKTLKPPDRAKAAAPKSAAPKAARSKKVSASVGAAPLH